MLVTEKNVLEKKVGSLFTLIIVSVLLSLFFVASFRCNHVRKNAFSSTDDSAGDVGGDEIDNDDEDDDDDDDDDEEYE